MTAPIIETPRGTIKQSKNGKAQLIWDSTFQQKWQGHFSKAQMFVDSEILRLSEPYIPLDTSMLIKSGILGTHIGSGTVKWIASYAKAQYYKAGKVGSQTGALRGAYWFERMKQVKGKRIIAGARRIAGTGRK